MAALHRPQYKVSFHLGGAQGGLDFWLGALLLFFQAKMTQKHKKFKKIWQFFAKYSDLFSKNFQPKFLRFWSKNSRFYKSPNGKIFVALPGFTMNVAHSAISTACRHRPLARGSAKVFFMGSSGPFNPKKSKIMGSLGKFLGSKLDPLTSSTVKIKGSKWKTVFVWIGQSQWH